VLDRQEVVLEITHTGLGSLKGAGCSEPEIHAEGQGGKKKARKWVEVFFARVWNKGIFPHFGVQGASTKGT